MQIIDLSVSLENIEHVDRPGNEPKIKYYGHHETFNQLAAQFPGLTPADLPDEEAWAVERIDLSTHNGTHMDAPWHYATTMDGGKRAWTIDEVPLEWCFQPGVKLDLSHLSDGHVVSVSDLEKALDKIDHELRPLEIVLIHTRAGERYGKSDYLDSGCGMGREATIYLAKQGIRVMGTDAWSWDAPFSHTARRYRETKDPSIIWEGHKAGREVAYCQLEKLTNLNAIPAKGFKVACFPVKIRSASAGWTRTVAILD